MLVSFPCVLQHYPKVEWLQFSSTLKLWTGSSPMLNQCKTRRKCIKSCTKPLGTEAGEYPTGLGWAWKEREAGHPFLIPLGGSQNFSAIKWHMCSWLTLKPHPLTHYCLSFQIQLGAIRFWWLSFKDTLIHACVSTSVKL